MLRSQTGTDRSWNFSGRLLSRQRWARTAARWPPALHPPMAILEVFRLSSWALWVCI